MNILLAGICGKMGSQIYDELKKDLRLNIVGFDLVEPQFIHTIKNLTEINIDDYDILIDFTNKEISSKLIRLFIENKKIVISGTTGHDKEFINDMHNLAKDLDVKFIHSVNFARGIDAYTKIVKNLNYLFDGIEMVESHDISKLDAPSGTALMLGDLLGIDKKDIKSLRVHEVTPTHLIIFSNKNEKIMMIHQILNRKAFVDGFIDIFYKLVGD